MTEQSKAYSQCGEPKPLSEFYRDSSSHDGRKSRCKACDRRARKQYRDTHRDEVDASNHARRIKRKHGGARRLPGDIAICRACPDDEEYGGPLFRRGLAQFKGGEFRGSVAAGVIPNGSRWEYRPERDKHRALWEVSGSCLLEVGGIRVILCRVARDDDD